MASNLFLVFGVIFTVIALVVSSPFEDSDKCGVSDFPNEHGGERIINGTKVPQGKYPWLAFMPYPGCTATIVSRKYILTAGHCVCKIYPPPETPQPCEPFDPSILTVVVGSVNKNKGQELKLQEPLNFTTNIRRVCLSGKHQEGDPKKKVVITGWGDITGMDTRPIVLREGTARVADDTMCQKTYLDFDSAMICVASRNHTMAFHGDSGGPALIKENGRWAEIGITSYGTGEVDFETPINYARVSHFCAWIAENTNNEVKCDS